MDGALYGAFLVSAFLLVLAPGPDMLFIVAMGSRGGAATGFMAAVGVAAGLLLHAFAAALGLSMLVAAMPRVYEILRWAGAAYLVYLAVSAIRDREGLAATPEQGGRIPTRWEVFRKAFFVDILNPKVVLFYISYLPQFVNPGLGHVGMQFLLLGTTFVLVDFSIDGPIGLAAGKISVALRHNRTASRALNIFAASVLVGLAAHLLLVHD